MTCNHRSEIKKNHYHPEDPDVEENIQDKHYEIKHEKTDTAMPRCNAKVQNEIIKNGEAKR